MIESNIPNDKRDATIYLKARKDALIELNAMFSEHNIETSAYILGTMNNEVDRINELLGIEPMTPDRYEAEAKADHRTDI